MNVVSNFKYLFASSNLSPSDELLDMFHCSITYEDNMVLYAIPTESEIHDALDSLVLPKP